MVFLVVVPIWAGFANFLIPLMIGARDMAFPRLNAFSYWMFLLGGIVLLSSFFSGGGAAHTGWTGYPPLSEQVGSGNGQDLWILGAAHPHVVVACGRDQLHRDHPPHAHPGHDAGCGCRSSSGRSRSTRGCSLVVLPALSAGADDAAARPPDLDPLLRTRPRAAAPCSTSTSSGSSGTPRSTS